MAGLPGKTGANTDCDLDVDAEVTSRGTGGLDNVRSKAGMLTANQTNSGASSDGSSSPRYLFGAVVENGAGNPSHDGIGLRGASMEDQIDAFQNALLKESGNLVRICKELDKENKELKNRNDDLMRKVAELTRENDVLKKVITDKNEGGADNGNNGDLCPDNYMDPGPGITNQQNSPYDPTQTTSVGHRDENADPLVRHIQQEQLNQKMAGLEPFCGPDHLNEGAEAEQREVPVKEPSPEDCALYLAEKIKSIQVKDLLRNLGMTQVDIDDFAQRHQNDPKEQRVDGITRALSQLPFQDRIQTLLEGLVNSKMYSVAESFCDEFNIDKQRLPKAKAVVKSPQPLPPAEIPQPEPQNKLEMALKPFIKDPRYLVEITSAVMKERPFTEKEKISFKSSLVSWNYDKKTQFDKNCVSSSLLGVLNAWASVELDSHSPLQVYSIEYLVQSCRAVQRFGLIKVLKTFLETGVVGPSVARMTYLRDVSHTLKQDIIALLDQKRSDGKDWRDLAEKHGYNSKIGIWESKSNPAEEFWTVWTSSSKTATIGELYNWAVEHRHDIADRMEREN